MARLAGKVALITGGGTGIGRATAQLFAAEGARVVIAEINAQSGEQTAQLITQAGGSAIALRTDVTDPAGVEEAVALAEREFGALHILHNNAGGSTLTWKACPCTLHTHTTQSIFSTTHRLLAQFHCSRP